MKINDVVVALPKTDGVYLVTGPGTIWGVTKITKDTETKIEYLTIRGASFPPFVVESEYFRKATLKEKKSFLSSPDGAWLNRLIEEKHIQSLVTTVPEKKRKLLLPKWEVVYKSESVIAAICEPFIFEFMFYERIHDRRHTQTGKVPFPKFLMFIHGRDLYLWFLPKEANKENILDQYMSFPCIPNCLSDGRICMGRWEDSRKPEKVLEHLICSQWRYAEVGLNWRPKGWEGIKNTKELLAKYAEINADEVKWVPTGRTFKGYLKLLGENLETMD